MPASAVINSTDWTDSAATRSIPYFDGLTGPKWQTLMIRLQSGKEPSLAKVRIPLSAVLDEPGSTIAGIAGGPLASIKLGSRAWIIDYPPGSGTECCKIVGSVTEIVPDLASDSAIVTIEDDRYLLQGCPIVGAFWATLTGPAYINREFSHCNKGSKANCIFYGGQPFFCYENRNLLDGERPAAASLKSETKASHWSQVTALDYLRYCLTDGATTAQSQGFPVPTLPSSIIWPTTLTSALSGVTVYLERKMMEWPLNGNDINAIIAEVLTFSDFALNMIPVKSGGIYKNQMVIVPTRFHGTGQTLTRPQGGKVADDFGNPNIVTTGNLRSSSKNTYSRVYKTGSPVFQEIRVDTKTLTLRHGWGGTFQGSGAGDVAQAKDFISKTMGEYYVDASGNNVYKYQSFDDIKTMVWKKFPRLFCTYFVDPALNFNKNTNESAFPLAEIPRPILPSLCTTKLVDAAAGDVKGQISEPYPVPIEYWQPPAQPGDSTSYTPTATDTSSGASNTPTATPPAAQSDGGYDAGRHDDNADPPYSDTNGPPPPNTDTSYNSNPAPAPEPQDE